MYKYTIAKLVRAGESRIPPGGLRQDMIHGDIKLHSDDILKSDGFIHNGMGRHPAIYIRAIKSVYPQGVEKIYSDNTEPTTPIFFLQRGLSIIGMYNT